MGYGENYRYQRELKSGLSQAAVARAARTTQPAYSEIEAGRRSVGPGLRERLDLTLALGDRQDDERRPLYVLACEPAVCTFHSDRHGRLAAFADRDIADAAATFFRRLLGTQTTVAAAWPNWLGEMLALERTEPPPPFPGGGFLLDHGGPDAVHEQVGQFMREMVAASRERAAPSQAPAESVHA